jgi:hypothetical protein
VFTRKIGSEERNGSSTVLACTFNAVAAAAQTPKARFEFTLILKPPTMTMHRVVLASDRKKSRQFHLSQFQRG